MEREYCVYMHTAPNGKRYVGITCCHPRNRRWQNGYGYVENRHFFNAIKKYGWDQFSHEILADNLTGEEAGQLEAEYIKYYNTTDKNLGYNLMPGGTVGFHLPEEHKQKISAANSGKGNGMYGYRYSEEERRLMSERSVWRGKKHTEESRQKMRDSMAKRYESGWKPLSGREHPGVRAVEQYDIDGRHIASYYSAADASKKTGTQRSGICNCAKGKKKTAGGYMWRYAE